jgi:hypothetical protein
MPSLGLNTIVISLLLVSIGRAAAQEDYYLPLISEVVVVADVIALRQTGALEVKFDDTEKELRLDCIRLPNKESSVREKADELLLTRLLGKSVEVHVLGSQYGAERRWTGYALHV